MARKKKAQRKSASRPTKRTVISFRAHGKLVRKLDRYVQQLREEHPGGNWTRSSAALQLVALGLRGQEEES